MGDSAVDCRHLVTGAPMEERRRSPRTRVVELVYMNMQPENGGILLDVSSTGLGFQAAGPIATGEQIHFRLSAGWIDGIELVGDLMWLDNTRKRGGLRFGQLPEEVCKQIQEWVGESPAPSPEVRDSAPVVTGNAPPRQGDSTSAEAGHSFVDDRTSPSPPMRNQPDPGSARPPAAPVPGPPRFSPDPTLPAWAPRSPYNTLPSYSPELGSLGVHALEEWADTPHRKRRLGAIALTVALSLVVAAGVFSFLNKREAGESLIRLGEGLSGEHPQQSAKPEAAAIPSSIAASAPVSSLPATAPGVNGPATNVPRDSEPGAFAGSNAVSSASAADKTRQSAEAGQQIESGETSPPMESRQADPTPRGEGAEGLDASSSSAQPETKNASTKSARRSYEASPREDDGHTELALAQQYLRGTGVREDRAIAAHLLWVAVGRGNTDAELELADLYLRGEGVPRKNCEQARILLIAASNSRNPVAGRKLAELRDYGCR
jgi:hypothetical protein